MVPLRGRVSSNTDPELMRGEHGWKSKFQISDFLDLLGLTQN